MNKSIREGDPTSRVTSREEDEVSFESSAATVFVVIGLIGGTDTLVCLAAESTYIGSL